MLRCRREVSGFHSRLNGQWRKRGNATILVARLFVLIKGNSTGIEKAQIGTGRVDRYFNEAFAFRIKLMSFRVLKSRPSSKQTSQKQPMSWYITNVYLQIMHMHTMHHLCRPVSESLSKIAPEPKSQTPRFPITNPVLSNSLPDNRILHNHTPLRPTIIFRPPHLLPLTPSTHQPSRINNMTPLERQRERLRVCIRQHQSVRQRINRESRVIRPMRRSDRSRERREC